MQQKLQRSKANQVREQFVKTMLRTLSLPDKMLLQTNKQNNRGSKGMATGSAKRLQYDQLKLKMEIEGKDVEKVQEELYKLPNVSTPLSPAPTSYKQTRTRMGASLCHSPLLLGSPSISWRKKFETSTSNCL